MIVQPKLDQPQATRVYSAPRRFDLATLFVVTIIYSLMFGILTALESSAQLIGSIAGFLSAIGIAQAVLFGGKKPRLASVITGGIVLPIIVGLSVNDLGADGEEVVLRMFVNTPFGLALGYLCGTLVGGVFLVAEQLRSGRGVF